MKKLCIMSIIVVLSCCTTVTLFATSTPEPEPVAGKEAPELAALVKQGKLDPLSKRLPENPLVTNAPEVGQYGGVLVIGSQNRIDLPFSHYVPVKSATDTRAVHNLARFNVFDPVYEKVEPDLAEKWEVSSDGKTITYYLRKGLRWSDGEPFTVDDIIFTYYEVLRNENPMLRQTVGADTAGGLGILNACTIGGELVEMEKIDDTTFKVMMSKPDPSFTGRVFAPNFHGTLYILPKHETEAYHPDYTAGVTDKDWIGSRHPNKKPAMMAAWTPTQISGDKLIYERNPYFHIVDREGKQLPYYNQFVRRYVTDPSINVLGLISGEHVIGSTMLGPELPTLVAEQATAPYKVVFHDARKGDPGCGSNFNFDDPDLGPIFSHPKFREAFSMIIDREKIADKVGPSYAPAYNIIWHRSPPLADAVADIEEMTMLPKFDRERGLRMFDELGIKDTDGDGWREFPPGHPKAGEPFGWTFWVEVNDIDRVKASEEITYQLEPLGFKMGMRVGEESVIQGEFGSGNFHMYTAWTRGPGVFHKDFEEIMNRSKMARFFPIALDERMPYYRQLSGTDGSKYLPWEKEMLAVFADYEAGKMDVETAGRKIIELMAQNQPNMPILKNRFWSIYSKSLKNMPLEYSSHMHKFGVPPLWSAPYMIMRRYEWFVE